LRADLGPKIGPAIKVVIWMGIYAAFQEGAGGGHHQSQGFLSLDFVRQAIDAATVRPTSASEVTIRVLVARSMPPFAWLRDR